MHAWPERHWFGPGQVDSTGQLPEPMQRVSQWQEDEQSMPPPHADWPPQVMSQTPVPQMSAPPQALAWLQVMVQPFDPEQLTPLPQADRPQETWQGIPAGQMTCVPQEESAVQSITQAPSVQRVHAAGQMKASLSPASMGDASPGPPSPAEGSTQKPSVQTRPS